MTSMARAIKWNRKAADSIQPIIQSQNHATSFYGLGGVHKHACIHLCIKVISRNQASRRVPALKINISN